MRCIYCLEENDSIGVHHAFPEGLGKNDSMLPKGSVCDKCNHYIGVHLDQNLIRYPIIAFNMQFIGTHGKRGRPRQLMAGISRKSEIETFN
ncbi:MAG: hypothetical protein JXA73_06145 [Acidobacteria bacterium]|nr:hypothetical protein [Acidobacteriota bacterium]